jgi:Superfamily II DNA and RNA helicases
VLVFTRTKHWADRLARQLDKARHRGHGDHGNKSQAHARAHLAPSIRALRRLVASDIAARRY